MAEWLQNVDFWHWWMLAIVLVILEVFSPAAFFLWLGISAGIVGLFMLIQPEMTWEWQLTLFALFSVVSTVLGRRWFALNQKETDEPALNRRGEQYVGRIFTLNDPIVNGTGKQWNGSFQLYCYEINHCILDVLFEIGHPKTSALLDPGKITCCQPKNG